MSASSGAASDGTAATPSPENAVPHPAVERLADFWARANMVLERGLTTREAADVWEEYGEGPCPKNLATRVGVLARRGELVVVGTFISGKVYASPRVPARFHVAGSAPDTLVAEALQQAVATTPTGAVSVTAIRAKLDARTRTRLDDSAVRRALDRLASCESIAIGGATYRVTRLAVPMRGASDRWLWSLVGTNECASGATAVGVQGWESPTSTRQAVLATVAEARARLRMPPTRLEWQLYVESGPAPTAGARMLRTAGLSGFQAAFRTHKSAARRQVADHQGLERLETPYRLLDVVKPRVFMGALSDRERYAAVAAEAVAVLRPSRELESIEHARAWWDEHRRAGGVDAASDAVVRDLLATRRSLLARRLCAAIPGPEWPRACEDLAYAHGVIEGWLRETSVGGARRARHKAKALLTENGAIESLREWVSSPAFQDEQSPATRTAALHHVPVHGIADAALLEAMWTALFTEATSRPPMPYFFRYARTAGAPSVRRGIGQRHALRRDRMDAWRAITMAAPYPRFVALLSHADGYVGHVLRDAAYLDFLLQSLPSPWCDVGRVLLVARGLLGAGPTAAERSTVRTADDARAVVLATFVSAPSVAQASLSALLTDWRQHHIASDVATNALIRIRCNEPLALVE